MLGFEFGEKDGKKVAEGVVEEDVENQPIKRICSIQEQCHKPDIILKIYGYFPRQFKITFERP